MNYRRNPPWWHGGDTVTLYHGTSEDFCKEDPPPMSRAPAWVRKGLKKPHANRREP